MRNRGDDGCLPRPQGRQRRLHQRAAPLALHRPSSWCDSPLGHQVLGLRCDSPEPEVDESESDLLPASCMWEVLRRLPPASLLAAAGVCKSWRDTTRRL
ncbi:hypothetical protein Tsubulata_006027 [Turnera subulata]|uniref:F-box domain-containing protein n=1 Tax=Turnera subulata TaxID=218843 RepID=A0A9Q0GAT1_9ROSI|nr:hypothetical protein Tsubulata_006027 [Turnera subulata]